MNAATRALAIFAIVILFGVGLLIWHSGYGAKAIEHKREERLTAGSLTSLSAEDVATILESQYQSQPQALQELATNVEARKEVLETQFKPLLALGRQARLDGIAEEKEIKEQLEETEMILLAFAYENKLKKDAGKENDLSQPLSFVGQQIPKEEFDQFWRNPENDKKFEKAVKAIEARTPSRQQFTEVQRKEIREQWATAMIAARKAKEAGVAEDRATRLQIGFQQARILATEYAKRHQKELEVSKEEIAAYVKDHPELDAAGRRAKVEQVLQRAKAGEDFAKLANEFSEDPGLKGEPGKGKDGLYENVKKGQFVPQFEAAALAMQPGQISEVVETQFGYHIIKLEAKSATKDKDGKDEETFSARHILIGTSASDPTNPLARPVPLEQKAARAAQQAKVEKFIEEITARNKITLPAPDAIKITAPEISEDPMMQNLRPGAEEDHAHPPVNGGADAKGKTGAATPKKR